MKSTITAAALTTLAFATPAMAQDADSTGVYGAIHAGLNMPSKQPFTLVDAVNVAIDEGEDIEAVDIGLNVDSKNAIEVGGTLGYDFGVIRADVDVSYSRAKVKSLTFVSVDGTAVPADTLDGFGDIGDIFGLPEDAEFDGNTVFFDGGRLRRLSAMANLWLDIPVGNGFAPYVGGGLGIQNLKFAGEGKSTFAWQLGAGVSVPVSERVAISADYRYRQQKGFTLTDTDLGDLRFGKAKSSSIFVSLRFNFGGTNSSSGRTEDCSGPC